MLVCSRTISLILLMITVAACAAPLNQGDSFMNRYANPAPATAQGGDAFRLYQDVLQY